ncbi:hypothetical protein HDK77DRAFT_502059 [Phyllosticta capitalensis]
MEDKPPNAAESEQSFVTLKVGPLHKVFLIHKDIICNKSEFFMRAFQGNFKEGKEQVVVLEETEEDVFKVVMQYLYTERLPDAFNGELKNKIKTDDEGNTELEWDFLMSGAYVFAKMYFIHGLPSKIEWSFSMRFKRSMLIPTANGYPNMATIIRVFNSVPEDSGLCKLFLERFSHHWKPNTNESIDDQLFQQLPLNFALLAIEALAKRRDEIQSQKVALKEGHFYAPSGSAFSGLENMTERGRTGNQDSGTSPTRTRSPPGIPPYLIPDFDRSATRRNRSPAMPLTLPRVFGDSP